LDIIRRPRSAAKALVDVELRKPEREFPPDLDSIIPTPLESGRASRPIRIEPLPPQSRFRGLAVLVAITRFVWMRLWLRVTGRMTAAEDARLARNLFEGLSGMWIKAGQLLSLRTDLLTDEMCQALAGLQHEVAGFPSDVALRVVEEDLGVPISRVFSWFDPTPFAAASICQAHRATLLQSNRAVVVKVMRPDVARSFARDLRLLRGVVAVFSVLGIGSRLHLVEGLRELRAVLSEETDYRFEAVNLKRMRRNLRRHKVSLPRVISRYCGPRILVMDEIPGVLMSHYLQTRMEDPASVRRWEHENNIDAAKLGKGLIVTVLRQILEDNEFHADMHPGNIMIMADNRIALLDLGSVGRLDRRTWQLYRYTLTALATRDFERAADYTLLQQPGLGVVDHARLRSDLAEALRRWELRSEFPNTSYADRSVASMGDEIMRVMARHKVPVGWGLMRVGRALSTLDASLQVLVPDGNFMAFTRAYFKDRQRRQRTLKGAMAPIRSVLQDVMGLATDANVVLGSAVRFQGLRLQGMADRVQQFRLAVLRVFNRGIWTLITVTLGMMLLNRFVHYLPTAWRPHAERLLQFVLEPLPDLDGIYWLLFLALALFISNVLRTARKSLSATQ
jgi:ubiquinone biosynthesis protein